ncbi:hypothetical protein evm_002137 [Chilo suppressalis]|nr:hypothetical protein evm_002137 [Chilo suppressalis]
MIWRSRIIIRTWDSLQQQTEPFDQEAFEADQEKAMAYRKKWFRLQAKHRRISSKMGQSKSEPSLCSAESVVAASCDNRNSKSQQRLHMPKLELMKFDGNIKNWLLWWGQLQKIHDADSEICELITASENWDEKEFEKELDDTSKYQTRWALLEAQFDESMANTLKTEPKNDKPLFKLPMLEIKKFDGNIKNWLSFWGQYKKVDSDPTIDETDKLQYLSQSMELGSEVKQFVESFPLTRDSYDLCLNELKSRYAREELLTQMYVRELLSLILARESNSNLTNLYDNINSHLRALEVLGVTKEKYAAFLLPMVESALPTEILRVWERAKPVDIKDELNSLLAFLKREVESNQRIELASNFKIDSGITAIKSEPTASCFSVNVKETKDNGNLKCIWCDKTSHHSTSCYKISKMTLEERRLHLKKKKACALCLKIGHHAKICKTFIKCYVCGQRHSPVLCPGSGQQLQGSGKFNLKKDDAGPSQMSTPTVVVENRENKRPDECDFGTGREKVLKTIQCSKCVNHLATNFLNMNFPAESSIDK